MTKEKEADGSAGGPHVAACRAAYDRWEAFASSPTGTWLMFCWAFAEAIVWPVIPDVLLMPMAVANRRRFYVPLGAAMAGSALGGAALYLAATLLPDQVETLLRLLPLVSERQITVAQTSLAAWGAAALLAQPWSGVPLKVWALVAVMHGIAPWPAIPLFIVARAIRMTLVALAARLLGHVFATFMRDFWLYLVALYVGVFCYSWWQVMQ